MVMRRAFRLDVTTAVRRSSSCCAKRTRAGVGDDGTAVTSGRLDDGKRSWHVTRALGASLVLRRVRVVLLRCRVRVLRAAAESVLQKRWLQCGRQERRDGAVGGGRCTTPGPRAAGVFDFYFFFRVDRVRRVTRWRAYSGKRWRRRRVFSTTVHGEERGARGGVNDRLGLRMAGAGGVLAAFCSARRSRRTRDRDPYLPHHCTGPPHSNGSGTARTNTRPVAAAAGRATARQPV